MRPLRRMTLGAALLLGVLAAGAREATFVTWNMQWFPSGRANASVGGEVALQRSAVAARKLLGAVEAAGGRGERVVFCLQEMQDALTCSNLVAQIGAPHLAVASVSAFRDTYGRPLAQQAAILTTLPVVEAGAVPWRGEANLIFGRGFTYAILDWGDGTLAAVFCIHLKSNLNRVGTELETQRNIYKREATSRQILDRLRAFRARFGERLAKAVVAGDFNTNEDDETFVSEATLRSFYGAHFRNCFSGLKKSSRITHPGRNGFPDTTFDYILYRGFNRFTKRCIVPGNAISDHNPVAITLE